MRLDAFGCIWMCSDVVNSIRTLLDFFFKLAEKLVFCIGMASASSIGLLEAHLGVFPWGGVTAISLLILNGKEFWVAGSVEPDSLSTDSKIFSGHRLGLFVLVIFIPF